MHNTSNLFVAIVLYLHILLLLQVNCTEYEENGIYPQKKHSLTVPFLSGDDHLVVLNTPHWETVGHAVVNRGYIRLTEDKQHQTGGIWNMIPIKFHNWEVQMEFSISGSGKIYQDGMAFWYVQQPLQQGHVFGNGDYFTGLGVFMDTFPNKYHGYHYPYISAMLNNGTVSYDSDNDGKVHELAGCASHFRNATHPTLLSIQYYDGLLKVRTDVDARNKWTLCLAARVDLPSGYFIGVTASTGHLSDNHDLVELRTYKLDSSPPTSRDDSTIRIVMPKYSINSSTCVTAHISFILCAILCIFII